MRHAKFYSPILLTGLVLSAQIPKPEIQDRRILRLMEHVIRLDQIAEEMGTNGNHRDEARTLIKSIFKLTDTEDAILKDESRAYAVELKASWSRMYKLGKGTQDIQKISEIQSDRIQMTNRHIQNILKILRPEVLTILDENPL